MSKINWRQHTMFILLPVAIIMAFGLPHPLGIIQATVCAFFLGMKISFVLLSRDERPSHREVP